MLLPSFEKEIKSQKSGKNEIRTWDQELHTSTPDHYATTTF